MPKLNDPCPVPHCHGVHEVYRIKGGDDTTYKNICRACGATEDDERMLRATEDTEKMLRFARAAVEWRQKAETLELEKRHTKERLKSVMREALHALYTGDPQEARAILEVYSSREALNDDVEEMKEKNDG